MLRATNSLGALALSFLLVCPALAADKATGDAGIEEAARLCAAPDATVAFSCKTTENRLIAVCSQANGALRLEFQTADKPDTRVSLPPNPADKAGVRVGSLLYSGGGGSYGRFKAAPGKAYVVYSGFGKGWEQAGLAVVKGDDHVAEYVCLPASKAYDIGFALLGEKGGYPVDATEDFEIDVK